MKQNETLNNDLTKTNDNVERINRTAVGAAEAVTNIQNSFQNGCKTIADQLTALGVQTSATASPEEIANNIKLAQSSNNSGIYFCEISTEPYIGKISLTSIPGYNNLSLNDIHICTDFGFTGGFAQYVDSIDQSNNMAKRDLANYTFIQKSYDANTGILTITSTPFNAQTHSSSTFFNSTKTENRQWIPIIIKPSYVQSCSQMQYELASTAFDLSFYIDLSSFPVEITSADQVYCEVLGYATNYYPNKNIYYKSYNPETKRLFINAARYTSAEQSTAGNNNSGMTNYIFGAGLTAEYRAKVNVMKL